MTVEKFSKSGDFGLARFIAKTILNYCIKKSFSGLSVSADGLLSGISSSNNTNY